MYSFLLRPRWLRLIAAVVVVAAGCVLLGLWQFERLEERHTRNELIRRHLGQAPLPVGTVAHVGRDLPQSQQWLTVRARGRYDERRELLVRNRVLDGVAGYHVLTPLVTTEGPALLVVRGWVPSAAGARAGRPTVPPPPPGLVAVEARLRPPEPSAGAAAAPAGQVRRIAVDDIARRLPYEVYRAYGELVRESPAAASAPRRLPPPEVAEGPHLAYAFQWFVFAVVAVVGVAFLARREAREGTAGSKRPVDAATR